MKQHTRVVLIGTEIDGSSVPNPSPVRLFCRLLRAAMDYIWLVFTFQRLLLCSTARKAILWHLGAPILKRRVISMFRPGASCLFLAASTFCLVPRSGHAQQANGDIQSVSLDSLLDIQVSGPSRYAQHMTRAPASITLITADEIERLGYRNLNDLFADTRGLYITYDRNYFGVGVRGFNRPGDYGNRVSILINGHRINESVYGSAPNGSDLTLDMRTIDRIEIIRGPGAALYGTGAMLAVVNIITRTGESADGIQVSAETGSFGRLNGAARYGRRFAGGLDLSIAGTWSDVDGQNLFFEEYDDPQTNDGVAAELDWEKSYGVLTTAAYRGLTFQSFFSSRRKGIPTGSFGTAFNDDRSETLDEYSFIELKSESPIGFDKSITLRGQYNFYNYEGDYPYDLEDYNTLYSETSDERGLGVDGQFRWDYEASNRLIVGVEYLDHLRADYRSKDQFEGLFSGDFPFHTFSVYVHKQMPDGINESQREKVLNKATELVAKKGAKGASATEVLWYPGYSNYLWLKASYPLDGEIKGKQFKEEYHDFMNKYAKDMHKKLEKIVKKNS
jgi:hypothetical protein